LQQRASLAKFQQKLFDWPGERTSDSLRTLSIAEHSSPTSYVRIRSIASQPFEFYMFKYSYDSLVYYGEPVDWSFARFGYDAIELVGEPDH
jgi:hypothetical protein